MNNILVITYWDFQDALIQTYTLPYVRIIKKNLSDKSIVWLLTLEKNSKTMSADKRDQIKESLFLEGIKWISYSYNSFGFKALLMWMKIISSLIYIIICDKINVIHCWATPAGAIGYILSVLTRKPLVIDSYEPHAESMVENGTWKKNGMAFKILFWLEKKQTQRAHTIIGATEGMRHYAKEKYGYVPENFWVKPACVDMDLFSKDKIKKNSLLQELNLTDKIVCVYAGKFGGIYLENETFDFFKAAYDFWGNNFRIILLSSHTLKEIENYCASAGLNPAIIILKFVPHAQVPDYMGLGDFAITPVKPVPTKRYCTPIKDGEYWALGLPVIIPQNISDDSEIIEENDAGVVIKNFQRSEYDSAVRKINELLSERFTERFSRINRIAHRYRSFKIAEQVYQSVYGKSLSKFGG